MIGLAGYQKTPTPWGWEYYPPPYRFASPVKGPIGSTPDYANARYMGMTTRALSNQGQGLGCAGKCGCHGRCGMGQVNFGSVLSTIQSTLTNPVTVMGFTFPLWIGLAGGIAAIALVKGMKK